MTTTDKNEPQENVSAEIECVSGGLEVFDTTRPVTVFYSSTKEAIRCTGYFHLFGGEFKRVGGVSINNVIAVIEQADGCVISPDADCIRFDDVNGGKMNKYKVTFNPSIEGRTGSFVVDVETDSLADVRKISDVIGDYTLFLHSKDLMKDDSNTGFIERWNEGNEEWEVVDEYEN